MIKTLKNHASLRGVYVVNDEARLSRLAMTQSVEFTMSEILLSLTIIGVVAAITLPSLMANINERTWNTQRKALYARMSQAIAMMPSVGGYGTLTEDESGSVTVDTAAETFLTEGLSKVLKINNICDSEHLADCGLPVSYTTMTGDRKSWPKTLQDMNPQVVNFEFVGSGWGNNGTDAYFSYSQTDTKAAAFETPNGESIAAYYYPRCENARVSVANDTYYVQPKMCVNFIYDLNGNKGPNVVGKDIGFITALYPTDTVVVAPMPLPESPGRAVYKEAAALCSSFDIDSRVPNNEELMSVFYNKYLVASSEVFYDTWSNTRSKVLESWLAYSMHILTGQMNMRLITASDVVMCIKR